MSKTESVRSPANAHSGSAPSAQVLSGWKDIANYLAKGVRTVQRYERDFGLPVRRPAGKPSASVMAVKLELDRWIISRPHRLPVSSSSTASSLGSSDKALKNTFAEMDVLYRQGRALRGEIMESVARLREVINRVRESEIKGDKVLSNRKISSAS